MRTNHPYIRPAIFLGMVILSLALMSQRAMAQRETVLHNFSFSPFGGPQAGVIFDAAGNIYGTTPQGVYELTPTSSGGWEAHTLYVVPSLSGAEGLLVFDAAGDVYGVRLGDESDFGAVFELTTAGSGSWTEKTLYTFPLSQKRGSEPYAGVIFDSAGSLFGTTVFGGAYCIRVTNGLCGGTAYELSPKPGGGWSEKVIHSFGNGTDGDGPLGGLIFDTAGNLYGTTSGGGKFNNGGTVFELSPKAGGGWTERILHDFGNAGDGIGPVGNVIFDSAGNLYGTTTVGGLYGDGTAYELVRQGGGGWKEKILFSFGNGSDGQNPEAGLAFDLAGNLYGTTFFGGLYNGGIVFELSPHQSGSWTETILHEFGNSRDGNELLGNVLLDASGNLFGTAQGGGGQGGGIVWKITP